MKRHPLHGLGPAARIFVYGAGAALAVSALAVVCIAIFGGRNPISVFFAFLLVGALGVWVQFVLPGKFIRHVDGLLDWGKGRLDATRDRTRSELEESRKKKLSND